MCGDNAKDFERKLKYTHTLKIAIMCCKKGYPIVGGLQPRRWIPNTLGLRVSCGSADLGKAQRAEQLCSGSGVSQS